jgi:hypothetical protein
MKTSKVIPFLLALAAACQSDSAQTGNIIAPSPVIKGLEWLGEQISYPDPKAGEDVNELGTVYTVWFRDRGPAVRGDTFPMTWADDGEIYASSGDPHWGKKYTGLDVEKFSGLAPDYKITKVNEMYGYIGNGGEGPKPSGMICVDGVLYLAFQNLLGKKPPVYGSKSQHGTNASIVCSKDHGKTWTPDINDIKEPMFPGYIFGGPAFINFGKNNENARDNYVYAVSAEQWDNGTNLRLGRVPKDKILDKNAWQFVCGFDANSSPAWCSDMNIAIPILSNHRKISLPDMVYIKSVNRYLLLTWALKRDFDCDSGSELYIYDSPQPWGPFALTYAQDPWENEDISPYCPRILLKWLRQTEGGIEGWMQFSGSWRQNSLHYRSHVRKFRLVLKE